MNAEIGEVVSVRKELFALLILFGALVAFLLPGSGEDLRGVLSLKELLPLLEAGGVRVKGIELEGWGVLRGEEDPREFRRFPGGEDGLNLTGARVRREVTAWGPCLRVEKGYPDGTRVLVSLQKVEKSVPGNLWYIIIKCRLPGADPEVSSWEKRITAFLAAYRESGMYFTVRGELERRLDTKEQLAWGRALYRYLGGEAPETVRTPRYLNLIGYIPLLPETGAGVSRYNLNLALVNGDAWNNTQVYLGSPVITSEY